MKQVFVDTSAFVAKEIAADPFHDLATRTWREISEGNYHVFSSEHVLDETATVMARKTTCAWASEWGNDVLGTEIEWLRANSDEWRQAMHLMRKFADQRVTFTDCISAVLMKRVGVRQVFGFDRHFEPLGFRVWPLT